ncbi:hypothetical protein D3C85_1190180 [compost metagenome]
MVDLLALASGQKGRQVPLPAGGVLALAEPPHPGSVQHALDPTADALSGLGQVIPDRLKRGQNHLGVDHRHVSLPYRRGVLLQRGLPLGPLLRRLPAALQFIQELARHLLKSLALRGCPRGLADCDRVAASLNDFTG